MKTLLAAMAAGALVCSTSAQAASKLHDYDYNHKKKSDTVSFALYNLSSGNVYRVEGAERLNKNTKTNSCENFSLSKDRHPFVIPDSVRIIGNAYSDKYPGMLFTPCTAGVTSELDFCIKPINGDPNHFSDTCFTVRVTTKYYAPTPSNPNVIPDYNGQSYFDIIPIVGPLGTEPLKLLGDMSRDSRKAKTSSLEPAPVLISSRFKVTLQRYEKFAIVVSDVGPSYRCPVELTADNAETYGCVSPKQ